MCWALGMVAMVSGLQACVGPDFKFPTSSSTQLYTPGEQPSSQSAGGRTQHLDIGQELPADWWTLFHSPALNALVERSLRDNPNMEAAKAALRVVQANLYAGAGPLFPEATLTYNGSGGRGGTSAGTDSANIYSSLHTAQFTVSYGPDVWGGTRRQIENLEALKENQRFQNEATFLTLTSNIAAGAIQEGSYRAQIRVTERLLKTSREILDQIRKKRDQGQVADLDVFTQELLVTGTEATLPPLRKALDLQRDSLTVLSGQLPGAGLQEQFELADLKLPSHLPISLPSDLVWQRPDVRAAEATLHAACALIGVSIANRLPQFSISGDIGRSGTAFSNLFSANPAFYLYSGVANATQVVFDGFTLQQQQRAAEAGFDEAAAQYRLAVLTAFQNVADALHSLRHDTVALQKAIAAEEVAAKVLKVTRIQLDEGEVSIEQILWAQTSYLEAMLAVIEAETNRLMDTAGLFQALGGGWWNRASHHYAPEPRAWLTSVTGIEADPITTDYPGATRNESRANASHESME